jgi:V8-like Glu-specific endopeptidase
MPEEQHRIEGLSGALPLEEGISIRKLLSRRADPTDRKLAPRMRRGMPDVVESRGLARIFDTENPPWRMICALDIEVGSRWFVGTGWLLGPHAVITAGHCVYNKKLFGGWASKIYVTPGQDDDERAAPTMSSTKFDTAPEWRDSQEPDPDFDYGVIWLSRPVGEQLGTFGVAVSTDENIKDAPIQISGYPRSPGGGDQQWFHANRVRRATARRLYYDEATYPGHSGSPVWVDRGRGQQPDVVAIHGGGFERAPAELGIRASSGARVTRAMLDTFRAWYK